MNHDQRQRFEKDIQAAVFRVMRQWHDKPAYIQRRDLVVALLTVAHAQLQFFDSRSIPRK